MKKKSISLLVISLVGIAGITTGIVLWGDFDLGSDTNIAYYAYASEPILNWDPAICFSDGLIVLNNVYETLLKYDPYTEDFEYVLATDYESSLDGYVWNFTLRENVTFHDGTAFNASSVKYSIDRYIELGTGASFIWAAVDNVTVLSEFVVEFNLMWPAPLDLTVACPYGAFILSPTAAENNPANWFEEGHEAGTGPYQLESFIPADEVVLAKYENYRGGWEENQFDKVIIKKHYEPTQRRQLVESGEADITSYLAATDLIDLQDSPDVEISDNMGFTNMLAHFNTEKAPLDNVEVRQALAYIFPYQDVIETAAEDYANQSTGAIPAGLWGHSDDLHQYNYNKTLALELFANASVDPTTLELELTYTSGDDAQRVTAELYQAKLADIGITLTITQLPWESQWARAKNSDPDLRQDIYLMYWWPDVSSPMSWLYGQYATLEDGYDIAYNLAYYSNWDVDDLIYWADAESAFDKDFAESLFIEAQEIIIEDCPSIFIYDQRDVFVLNPTFQGFNYNPSYPNTIFFYECYRGE